ncbi:SAM-dependent methyltransferase, partial [Amycolatopsis sp. SID8362]|nr:SAM-dependent methyltransferase [Amycolatopsis sp. SID8362]NED42286.1 SAM-dependent methyltransferase [Amycolatopsis sp. SID8362]
PVAGPAKAARVLRPGGLLAVFAHVFQPPAAVADALKAAMPGSPFAGEQRSAAELYEVMFTGFADAIRASGVFGEPERRRFTWEKRYTREEWLDFLPTTGGLTRLAPEALAEVLAAVGAAIEKPFVLPYTTLAVFAAKP